MQGHQNQNPFNLRVLLSGLRAHHGILFLLGTDGYGFQEPRVQMVRGCCYGFRIIAVENGRFWRNSVCCGPLYGSRLSRWFGYGPVSNSRLSLRVGLLLTNRASTLPSNIIRGCQSGTWSAGQENMRGTSTTLQREHDTINTKTKQKRQKERRNSNTNHMPEKYRRWALDRESLVYRQPRAIRYPPRIVTISHELQCLNKNLNASRPSSSF